MTLTFPRDLPQCGGLAPVPFALVYNYARAVTGGGSPAAVSTGPALWRGAWQVDAGNRASFAEWSAWVDTMRGGLKLFKAVPPRWTWPRAYPRGFSGLIASGSPWNGVATAASIGAGRDTVTLAGLPAAFVLAPGDYLSVPAGSRQHLHKIVEGGTASGGGGLAVTIEPTLRPNVSSGAAVRLAAPYCEMALTGDPEIVRNMAGGGRIAFEALQVLI